ncbi:hypothetical protein Tco_0861535 [Tanacetum coccineum]|uniref:Uncharacterized protein n=1 Tax=Tanacetum coccineum TaxID=301880 RepID=A0ABQ5BLP4_9ASTR
MEQMKGECDVLKEREKARDKECEDLKAKYEAAMVDFDNNPAVNVLYQKIKSLSDEIKEHKASLERMLLEILLSQEVENVKRDRAEVLSKVVPYVAIELVCHAFEVVASVKEPFDLAKVKGYRLRTSRSVGIKRLFEAIWKLLLLSLQKISGSNGVRSKGRAGGHQCEEL